jgi:hypothetical protein
MEEGMSKLAVLMLLAAVSSAHAEDWIEVGTDSDSVHFVDRESLSQIKDVATLRKKVIFNVAQLSVFTKNSESVKYSVGTVQEDCTGNQHRVLAIELFNEVGEAIWSSGKMNRIWESVEPDSVGATTHAFACGSSR